MREFKTMVKTLHSARIEVILDVVYNHTAEGNHLGPTLQPILDGAAAEFSPKHVTTLKGGERYEVEVRSLVVLRLQDKGFGV